MDHRRRTIEELPPPPVGKTGWPWTVGSGANKIDQRADTLPLVTIVTPSYNQGIFIEETIRSVLLQGYEKIDYIIIDGGSNDCTLEIIKKYEPWLSFWVSEKDKGQCHAVNKGWEKAREGIWAFLNSDDTYLPDAIHKAVDNLINNPEYSLAFASVSHTDVNSNHLYYYRGIPLKKGYRRMFFWRGWHIPQASVFFNSSLVKKYGGLNESFHLALDYEWFIRVSKVEKFYCVDDIWATARIHENAKTGDWETNKHRFFIENRRANRLNSNYIQYVLLLMQEWVDNHLFSTSPSYPGRLKRKKEQLEKKIYFFYEKLIIPYHLRTSISIQNSDLITARYFRINHSLFLKFNVRPDQDFTSLSVEYKVERDLKSLKKVSVYTNGKLADSFFIRKSGRYNQKVFFNSAILTDNKILCLELKYVCNFRNILQKIILKKTGKLLILQQFSTN
ncbi:MAG: glycosyltransferase family 2 protein [Bacteroidales bacterium]|nr:glycosyltransferase family 2 protein [Bacteroidales bacterium]